MSVSRYWHTIRFLKPVQLFGRIRFRLAKPRIDLRAPAPGLRPSSAPWVRGAERPPTMTGARTFRFLNHSQSLEAGWDDPRAAKLWRYNLHYFDDLNATDADARADWHRALLRDWVEENPPTVGSGWEPYPTSLRIVNWIKWALRGNALPPECARSLGVQARWLEKRIEHHLLGNHLFANAKALVFAGLYHEGHEARRWLEVGCRILAHEVPEQILPDGGQFELSPMYHSIALEDMLDLCNVTTAYVAGVPARWRELPTVWAGVVPSMRRWLAAMTHPDGAIAFFNDAAFGIAPSPSALDEYSTRLGFAPSPSPAAREPLSVLASSGYVRADGANMVAIADVGAVGPDYIPGHAHADTLSFECSLFGHRVFVNSGTSVYGDSAERQRQRGTAAHNTVVVNGTDSSEVWAGFRVARRARPVGLALAPGTSPTVRCSHDGYRRLPGAPTHQRQWTFGAGRLDIVDSLAGRFESAVARFHLHPAIEVGSVTERGGAGEIELRLPGGREAVLSILGGRTEIHDSTWHPEFGLSVANRCVAVIFEGPTLQSTLRWA